MPNMSKRREIAIEVIEAYKSWDIERIMAYRTDECTQLVIPSSSNPAQILPLGMF